MYNAMTLAEVAPLAGAWIEIPHIGCVAYAAIVAPLAGAWIEINKIRTATFRASSRSPRGSVD